MITYGDVLGYVRCEAYEQITGWRVRGAPAEALLILIPAHYQYAIRDQLAAEGVTDPKRAPDTRTLLGVPFEYYEGRQIGEHKVMVVARYDVGWHQTVVRP